MSSAEKTPGYNSRLEISLSADKNGRPTAYYLLKSYLCTWRRIRMSHADAKLFVAQGQADEIPHQRIF